MKRLVKRLATRLRPPFARLLRPLMLRIDAHVLLQCQASVNTLQAPLAAIDAHLARLGGQLATAHSQYLEAAKESTLMVESLVCEVVRLQMQVNELREIVGQTAMGEPAAFWKAAEAAPVVLSMNLHREVA